MSAIKIVLTNHVLEVWEYEREPYVPDSKTNMDAITEYLLTGDMDAFEKNQNSVPGWIRELNKKNCKLRNGRNARAKFRRLCTANFTGQTNFITLTFENGAKFRDGTEIYIRSIEDTNKAFDQFMKRLRRSYGSDFKFAVVTEFQDKTRDGVIHYHMLADLGLTWGSEDECKRLEVEFRDKYWHHGFVDLKDVNHVDNIGAYMSKYMVKRMDDSRLSGKKAYRTSKNMIRPLVLKGAEAERILELYQLQHKKEVFTNSYESEYLGQITYKEYNLLRI